MTTNLPFFFTSSAKFTEDLDYRVYELINRADTLTSHICCGAIEGKFFSPRVLY